MDIDNRHGILRDKFGRKHLHITSEHHEINIVGREQFELLRFSLQLVLLGHWNVMESDSIKICVTLCVGVIADHQREIASQLSVTLAIEKIHEAVIEFGNKDGHTRTLATQGDAPVHPE